MRHRLIALPVSLAVAAGLTACGNEALSKEEYIKQADAICEKFQAKTKALPEPKSVADVGKLADQAEPLFNDQIDELRGLEAPDEIKDKTDDAYALLDQQVAKLGELRDAAKANDQKKLGEVADGTSKLSSEANAKAREIGLQVCGSGN